MNKLALFHGLQYWLQLPANYMLDSMYISKNVCKSSIEHLMEVMNSKTQKDHLIQSNTKASLWIPYIDENRREISLSSICHEGF
jgi:hypothetical protein